MVKTAANATQTRVFPERHLWNWGLLITLEWCAVFWFVVVGILVLFL